MIFSPSSRIAKEIGKRDRVASRSCRLEYKISNGNVEHAEAKRRKYPWLVVQRDFIFQNVDERAGDKVPIAGFDFSEVDRCLSLQAMIDVVNDVLRGEN